MLDEVTIFDRANALINNPDPVETVTGTLNLVELVYGRDHSVTQHTRASIEGLFQSWKSGYARYAAPICKGTLRSLKDDLSSGLIKNIQAVAVGEILGDFIALAKEALSFQGDPGAKNVAAVLTAAVFEDTIRRLATLKGIGHLEKLADVLNELKRNSVLVGAEVSIAQSYLSFRNKALHAQWDQVDSPSINSALSFSETLIVKHFS